MRYLDQLDLQILGSLQPRALGIINPVDHSVSVSTPYSRTFLGGLVQVAWTSVFPHTSTRSSKGASQWAVCVASLRGVELVPGPSAVAVVAAAADEGAAEEILV